LASCSDDHSLGAIGFPTPSCGKQGPGYHGLFWIIKLLTTALGEATTDFLVHRFNPYLIVPLGGIGLVIALAMQLSASRYVTWI
jgi:uncharacterized membrane-anchored protein